MHPQVFQELNFDLQIRPGLVKSVFDRLVTEERLDKKDLTAQVCTCYHSVVVSHLNCRDT